MSVFDQNNEQENIATVDTLVGEGRKYKTPDDLAKGYQHADAKIAELTKELHDLREANKSSVNITEAINNEHSNDEVKNNSPQALEGLSKEQLIDLVKGVVNEDKTLNTQQENLNAVNNFLVNKFGTEENAGKELARIANENGMDLETFKELSIKSPTAAINLCGGNGVKVNTATIPADINTSSQTQGVKGHSYYSELRKTNPKKYYSREGQAEMRNAIKELGEDFVNK